MKSAKSSAVEQHSLVGKSACAGTGETWVAVARSRVGRKGGSKSVGSAMFSILECWERSDVFCAPG